jgi:hypothetical protein
MCCNVRATFEDPSLLTRAVVDELADSTDRWPHNTLHPFGPGARDTLLRLYSVVGWVLKCHSRQRRARVSLRQAFQFCDGWFVSVYFTLEDYRLLNVVAAIYAVYTSPNHPPIPNHLPTLIVTPHGQPSNILYSYLHTNFVSNPPANSSTQHSHPTSPECGELPPNPVPAR